MVALKIRILFKNPGKHGAILHLSAQKRVVDGIVDQGGCVATGRESSKRQIVAPRDHGEDAVILVEIVVVDHIPGVAIPIEHEIVDDKVSDHGVDVQDFLQICSFV